MTVSINVACQVAPRAQLVADSQGKFPTPPATLNEMAKPLVTAPLTDDIICPVVAFSIGAEVAGVIPVTMQVKINGSNYANYQRVYAALVTSATDPSTIMTTACTTAWNAHGEAWSTNQQGNIITNASGASVASVTYVSGGKTVYMTGSVAGRIFVSDAITFA